MRATACSDKRIFPPSSDVDLRSWSHHARVVPQRKRYLFVCVNRRPDGTPKGSCAARGSVEIHAALKTELQARGLARTEVRACTSSCLDVCWAGPTIAVEPDGYFYGRVTMADVPRIAEAFTKGERVDELVLGTNEFEEATAGPALPVPKPTSSEGSS
jgi:(2Fe-2S) ferredoxin